MFKVLRSSAITVYLDGTALTVLCSESAFTPNRRFPQKIEKHEGQSMTAIRKAWAGHEDAWTGYVVSGISQGDGAVVYENVPFKPLHWANSEDGSIPGARPGGPSKVLGFLRKINASRAGTGGMWVIEKTFLYPGLVQKIGTTEKYRILGSVKDGRYHDELVAAE
jgi:hypothetical protein